MTTDRTVALLRRLLDLTARVLRGVTVLAVAAAVAVAAAWVAWLVDDPPAEPAGWAVRVVVVAVLLVPSAILALFVIGIHELRELPRRYRDLPADVRERATSLRSDRPRGLLGTLGALVQLGRLVLGSRDVLSPYTVVAAALRPAILLAALGAALVAAIEIPAAAVAILVVLV